MTLERVRHVCTRRGDHDKAPLGADFLRHGLARGDQCIYVARDTATVAGVVSQLPTPRADALVVMGHAQSYRRTGAFSPTATHAWWRERVEAAVAAGYRGLTVVGEVVSAADEIPRLPEYEAGLDALVRELPLAVMCLYDRPTHPPHCYGQLLSWHPHVVLDDGTVRANHHWFRDDVTPGSRDEHDLIAVLEGIRSVADPNTSARGSLVLRNELAAIEASKRALARELHDDLGQILASIRQSLQQSPASDAASFARLLTEIDARVLEAIESVRCLALDLRPSLLDDIGLAAALRSHLRRQSQRAGLEIELDVSAIESFALDRELASACFRLIQQALENAVRHSGAGRITVAVALHENTLELTVHDDGRGFDVDATRRDPRDSFGLLGMTERAAIEGGTLDIASSPGRGTTVRASVPVRAARAP